MDDSYEEFLKGSAQREKIRKIVLLVFTLVILGGAFLIFKIVSTQDSNLTLGPQTQHTVSSPEFAPQQAGRSDEMKLFSYPKLGFQISFPASWVVRDKSGDLAGDHSVEGRRSADTPSGLDDGKKPAMSKEEQQLADIAFLKGVRVTILVRDIERQPIRMSLSDAVNNRIQGIKMMGKIAGDDVGIKPLERVQLATVPAFVTRITTRHYKDFAQVSTTTIYL
jgi:hypothetical protein